MTATELGGANVPAWIAAACAVNVLAAIAVPDAVSRVTREVPTYGAVEGGAPVLLSNADGESPYGAIVRYQGRAACTGVFIDTLEEPDDPGDRPAYVLTNGHCSDFPGSNEVLGDRPDARGQVIFNYFADTRAEHVVVRVERVVYATMKGQDIAVLQLAARAADLVDRGFTPWRVTRRVAHGDEPVVVVGAPLQREADRAFLQLAACRLDGRAPLVLEYIWHWYGFDRNTCTGIQPGSSGSPVISRLTGDVVGLVNTTTVGGRQAFTACTLDHPCEPTSGGEQGRLETSYATPLVRMDRCFDHRGYFDLHASGCPLDPGDQLRATPAHVGAVNPLLASVPIGQPMSHWNVTLAGGFEFYRFKIARAPAEDCRDLRGYSPSRRLRDAPRIEERLPVEDGWWLLCIVGGRQSRWGDQWQSVDVPTVVVARVDTVRPRIAPPLAIDDLDTLWRVTFTTAEPEIAFYRYKFGRPADTRCDDAVDYRPALIPFISLPKSGRPYVFCAIPYDSALNAGAIVERDLF